MYRRTLRVLIAVSLLLAVTGSAAPPNFSPIPALVSGPDGGPIPPPPTDEAPHVAGRDGSWVTVFTRDLDIFASKSIDGGRNWGPLRHLSRGSSNPAFEDNFARAATDGQGNWITVWFSADPRFVPLGTNFGTDGDILIARSTNDAHSWTFPVGLNTDAMSDAENDFDPDIATDGDGNWVVVWRTTEGAGSPLGTDHDLLVARSTDAGANWTAPAVLNTNATTDSGDDAFVAIAEGGGTWIAAWNSSDPLGGSVGTDEDVFFARSTDVGVTWSSPQALNTNATSDSGDDWPPALATDGNGNWIAAWPTFDTLGGLAGPGDYDIAFARSTDDGLTWSAPLPIDGAATTESGFFDINVQIAHGDGTWIAVWETDRDEPFVQTDVLQARSTDLGATWSAPVAVNPNAAADTGNDRRPAIAADGPFWLVAWDSTNPLDGDTDPHIVAAYSPRLVPALGLLGRLAIVGLFLGLSRVRRRAPRRT